MSLVQLSAADWVVLVLYLLAVLAVGWVAARRVRTTDQYFLGGRRFGRLTMIAQSFGTGTHAEMPVSLAGIVFTTGLSGIWYQWKNLFVTPFYWLLAPLFRRFRRTTVSEVIEDRYGPWMGGLYTAFALVFFAINLASMLKGAAKVIDQSTGGHLPVNGLVVGMTVVFVLYSFFGGLLATAWTEVLQGFLIITLSFMVIPAGWTLVGGLGGMRATLGATKLTLVVPHGIGFWFIAALTINGLVGIVAQPHLIAAVGTGRDEAACRVGQFYGNFIKRICTVGWAIVGLIAATLVVRGAFGVTRLADPEEAFGFACRHLLFPGGIGLLVACFLAANMASCSAFMVDSGAMVTNGIYRKYLVKAASDRHYLQAGRIAGLLVIAAAVAYSVFFIQRILYAFLLTETMATFVGISVLGGIVWRRANRWGAVASLAGSLGVNFFAYAHAGQRLDYWSPSIFMAAFLTGIALLVIVSLLTASESESRLGEFFANLDLPSDGGGAEKTGAASGQALIIPNLFHLRRGARGFGVCRAYRTDLLGWLAGIGLVVILIVAVWLLLRLA